MNIDHADAIHLTPYDASWMAQYDLEIERIASVLPSDLQRRFEHFGSTAVPALAAKPIIDILIVIPAQLRWSEIIPPIEGLGYKFWRDNPRTDRQLYVKGLPPADTGRTHHVHVRIPLDAERELRFRDLLRADPRMRERYLELKERLAKQYRFDRVAYTEGKSEFIEAALSCETVGRGSD